MGGENARHAGWVFPGEEPATGAPVVAVVVPGVRIAEGNETKRPGTRAVRADISAGGRRCARARARGRTVRVEPRDALGDDAGAPPPLAAHASRRGAPNADIWERPFSRGYHLRRDAELPLPSSGRRSSPSPSSARVPPRPVEGERDARGRVPATGVAPRDRRATRGVRAARRDPRARRFPRDEKTTHNRD